MFARGSATAAVSDRDGASFRALYKELVEINTTLSSGSCTAAAEAMAAHLREAGLSRLSQFQLPIRFNPATRAYFEAESAQAMRAVLANPDDLAAADRLWTLNPSWNSRLRLQPD